MAATWKPPSIGCAPRASPPPPRRPAAPPPRAGRRRRPRHPRRRVEVNSETDFVAKNEQFQEFVRTVAELTLDTGSDIEALKAAPIRAPAPSRRS
jgi:hypothetical protein